MRFLTPFFLGKGKQALINYVILRRRVTFVGSRNTIYVWYSPDRPHIRLSEQEVSVYPKVTMLVSTGLLSCLSDLNSECKHYPFYFSWSFICIAWFPDKIMEKKCLIQAYWQTHSLVYVHICFSATSQSLTWKTMLDSPAAFEKSQMDLWCHILCGHTGTVHSLPTSSDDTEILLFCCGVYTSWIKSNLTLFNTYIKSRFSLYLAFLSKAFFFLSI